jgi:secreted PhoX family phosphatase
MSIGRRDLLRSAFAAGAGLVGASALAGRKELPAEALKRSSANADLGWGAVKPKAARNTGVTWLALPDGFEYNAFGQTGDKMADGRPTPAAHDGMAAFMVNGKIRLVRNHEVRAAAAENQAIGPLDKSYDRSAGGGCTTLIVNPETRELERDWVSLSGTHVNCAGGPSPWGSWLTCEETVAGNILAKVHHKEPDAWVGGYEREHGYVFEVPAYTDELADPEPIRGMGRFVHEAIAFDPSTGICYLTEDAGQSGFFRYIPNVPGRMLEGGVLQMARIVGKPQHDTRKGQADSVTHLIDWVTIENPDPADAGTSSQVVFNEGFDKGGAIFGRLEGAWYGAGCIYINSTSGGDARQGQVWQYRPTGEGGELTLIFESKAAEVLKAPDNICVSPRGALVVCEDGSGVNRIHGLTIDGRLFDIAHNVFNGSEFAGSCFSTDGRTLFVNIQTPGVTLAIWGPWEKGGL